MAAPPRVSVDLTAPAIVFGSRRVELCPLGDHYVVEGSLRVRLVTVAERREAVRLALASSDPSSTLLDELRRAALVGGAHPDADAIILALAGGAEEGLPFAASARRLVDGGAAHCGSIDDLAALVADRLAARAARPALTDDWVRIEFSPAAAADAGEIGCGTSDSGDGTTALCEAMLARLLARGTPDSTPWVDDRSPDTETSRSAPRPEGTSSFDDLARATRRAVTDAGAPYVATPTTTSRAAAAVSDTPVATAAAARGPVQPIAPREPALAGATSAPASIGDGSDLIARARHSAFPRPADAARERPRSRAWLGRGALDGGSAGLTGERAAPARVSALPERTATSRPATSVVGTLPDSDMSDFHIAAGLRNDPRPRAPCEASTASLRRSPFRSVASGPPEPFLHTPDDASVAAAAGSAHDPLYEIARALADECDLRGIDP